MGERSTTALTKELETALAVVDDVGNDADDETLLAELLAPAPSADDLDPQEYLEWENPDHQNLIHHMHDLTQRAAVLLAQMTPLERKVALQAQKGGRTYRAIAEAAGCSPVTVSAYLRDPTNTVHKYLLNQAKRTELAGVPQKSHRLQMAWRIAQRLETKKPEAALKALNLIAQQAGEMQRDKDAAPQTPTVVLANFNFAHPQDPAPDTAPATPGEASEVIEDAVYTVVEPPDGPSAEDNDPA